MKITKMAITITLILITTVSLSGCWSRRELNTLGIVGLVSIDTSSNGIKSNFAIFKPERADKKNSKKSETPVKFIQGDGTTIMDTVRDASLRFDRKLFLSQAKAFLFNEEVARNGLAEHLDGILRNPEMRLSMHLAIVKDSSAADAMGIAGGINDIPSNYIEDILKQYKVTSKSVDSKVLDFLKAYTDNGINPVVSVLKVVKKEQIGKEVRDEYELTAAGSAVFLKDRLVGFLDGQETRGYNWVIGNVIGGTVTFPIPNSSAFTSVEILHAESNNDVEMIGNNITITVKIKMNGMLDEQTTSANLTDTASLIETVELATAQAIKQEVEHTLLKVQKDYRSDIFGFGQLVHRKYPREWKNIQNDWNELFSQAIINVEIQANITKTGKSSYPVKQ